MSIANTKEAHNSNFCHLDNESFTVSLTANEWAGIAQLLEGMLPSGCTLDMVISAHKKIEEAARVFVENQNDHSRDDRSD
jgi:hypothetical protein